MAWRIHDNVKRGEIDNRERGLVRGRLWLDGYEQPVLIELQGNACPDLAGCLLAFENPGPTQPMCQDTDLHIEQRGTVGDLTASRKVRVFDLPFETAYARLKQKLPVPEHLANGLYLEWFSEANGRVVVESTDYRLTISTPVWTMSTTEEEQRTQDAASGFTSFVTKVNEALQSAGEPPPAEDEEEWDAFDELIHERVRRTDKFLGLLDQYMDHPDRDEIIAREMGWDCADAHHTLDQEDPEAADTGTDPPPPARPGQPRHPLPQRASRCVRALLRLSRDLAEVSAQDEDLSAFRRALQATGTHLAGALEGLAQGRDSRESSITKACLKGSVGHLHTAQAALERVSSRQRLLEATCAMHRRELVEIQEEILRLADEFRDVAG